MDTFEDKLRRKTHLLILIQVVYGFLMAAMSVGIIFYALFILENYAPQVIPFSIPRHTLLSLLVIIPSVAGIIMGYLERRDTIRLTLKLEKHYPHLGDRLLTMVEISQKRGQIEQNAFSRILASSLESDLMGLMERFSFNGAAQAKRLIIPVAIFVFLLTAGTVQALVQPDFFMTAFKRLTEPLENKKSFSLFKQAEFEIKVVPGDTQVPRGSNLMIQASTPGYSPQKAEIRFKKANETAWEEKEMEMLKPGEFQIQIKNIDRPYIYTVRIESQETPVYQIKIFESLSLEKVQWDIEYPAYTKIKPQTRQGWGGKIAVPKGTKLHLDLVFNQPVLPGAILQQDQKVFDLPLQSPKELRTVIEANQDYLLKLEVHSEKGDSAVEAPAVWIQVLPDLAPYLEILEPQQHNYVFPTQEIPFQISVNDDYGLKSVDLVFHYQGKEERIHWLPEGKTPDTAVLKPILKLEKFNLRSRDLVFAYIEVRDTYPGEDPAHAVKSELFAFLIRDYIEQYKINLPKSSTPSVRQYFEDILAEQEKIMADTWNYISQPPREGPLGWENVEEENKK